MAEYIDKSALYEKIAQLEELARNRYLETPSSNPCCSRYMTQLNERTVFKHIIADFPSADVAPVQEWIPVNERGAYTDITSLVADVNVNEIADHIRNGNLASWVQSWQRQMAFELENLKLSEKD